MAEKEPVAELEPQFSSDNATPTAWAEARERLEKAEVYWLATVRPDGRPHVTPLLCVWLDGALYFCTGPDERKAKNLARNPACVLTTGCNAPGEGLDLVVEGNAARVSDEAKLRRIADVYESEYGGDWRFTVRDGAFYHDPGSLRGTDTGKALVYELAPSTAFGFGKGTFSQTRWRFNGGCHIQERSVPSNLPRHLPPDHPPSRKETLMNDLEQRVQKAIDRLVESGAERGLQVAVYRHGNLAVDVVAGVADPATGRPATSDTPFFSFSVGKGVAATVAHVLAGRGVFGYDTRIVELWPEFGAHGKGKATVRHALSQSVGVPGLPAGLSVADLCDWDKMCATIAGAEPWWEPGTRIGYHAVTYGYIVGEIIRRATGKSISRVLREEVAEPLGVPDELFFGVPESELARLARLEEAEADQKMFAEMPEDSPVFKLGPPECTTAAYGNRADVLTADIPAGGTVTARAVARMYAALLGEVDGVRLVSPKRLREVSAVAMSGTDQIFGFPTSWGLGYSIGQFLSNAHETRHVFGVGGVGGSYAYADTATGTTFALTKNRLTPGFDTAEQVAGIVTKAVAGS